MEVYDGILFPIDEKIPPPEVILDKTFKSNKSADMWDIGVIFAIVEDFLAKKRPNCDQYKSIMKKPMYDLSYSNPGYES